MFDDIKKSIPKDYHYLFDGRMIDTSTIEDKYRNKSLHLASFNRCEKCSYDLLDPKSYKVHSDVTFRHPVQGTVRYYEHHKLILCDKCVDELNGQPWK